MHLPRHQHWIDGDADVVDGGISHYAADAGRWVDFDLADMRAVRPARSVDLALAVDAQPRAGLLAGNFKQADAFVGTDHREHAIAVLYVFDRSLEQVRCLLARFCDHVACGDRKRGASNKQRTGSDAAETSGQIRVALNDVDFV